jgi:hypothetical protein
MKRFWAILFFNLSALIFSAAVIYAQTPVTSIPGNGRLEYRLDYTGDGTPIRVVASETDVNNLVISIYTSEQIDAARRGENITPTGRASRVKDDTLQWAAGSRFRGVFYIVIENRAPNALTFRLSVTGDGVSGFARVAPFSLSSSTQVVNQGNQKILVITLPPGSITKTLSLPMPAEPSACTPPAQIVNPIQRSIKLCPGQTYAPLNIIGDNIAILGDAARSPVVTSNGRQFAITMEGSNNWIEGITIQARADPKDLNSFLCLYDECLFATRPLTTTIRGGLQYGGGILVNGANTLVRNVTVRGGTIGVATLNGRNNVIVENNLTDLNGWGSYNWASRDSYFVGNDFSRNNHGCTTPDGRKFLSGCETSGWVCLGCTNNIIAKNYCELSANCFYMSGERKLASNVNSFLSNYCAGATDNCFEITFSFGNFLRDNYATYEPKTNSQCKYPFWIGGSVAYFANNTWECAINEEDAFNQSRNSTTVATNIIRMDNYLGVINAPQITITPEGFDVILPKSRWTWEYVE